MTICRVAWCLVYVYSWPATHVMWARHNDNTSATCLLAVVALVLTWHSPLLVPVLPSLQSARWDSVLSSTIAARPHGEFAFRCSLASADCVHVNVSLTSRLQFLQHSVLPLHGSFGLSLSLSSSSLSSLHCLSSEDEVAELSAGTCGHTHEHARCKRRVIQRCADDWRTHRALCGKRISRKRCTFKTSNFHHRVQRVL